MFGLTNLTAARDGKFFPYRDTMYGRNVMYCNTHKQLWTGTQTNKLKRREYYLERTFRHVEMRKIPKGVDWETTSSEPMKRK